jgi:hypothetical protein
MEGNMEPKRRREVEHLLEACQSTDNSELDYEKTAVIAELLTEVERLGASWESNGQQQQE